jgi:flagellar basal body rod protein FlgG
MSTDLYSALSGARAAWRQMESIATNVSNANTAGFKSQRLRFEMFEQNGEAYVRAEEAPRDMRSGALERTGVPTDLALQGDGFFMVGDGHGTRLTRAGQFVMGPDGSLNTPNGRPVLGENGAVFIPPGETPRIDETGVIHTEQSGIIDRLRVVNAAAIPVGNGLWEAQGPIQDVETPHVVQGAIERSNVDSMTMMVELVEASRYFEAFQKAMQTSDELDQRLNQSGGRT